LPIPEDPSQPHRHPYPESKCVLALSSKINTGNRAAQDDEIEALKSIYGEEDFVLHGDYSCEVNFRSFSSNLADNVWKTYRHS
jgi:hypothetical protein